VFELEATEKWVTTGCVVEPPPPQALRRQTLQTKSKNNRDFFMTPPHNRIVSARTWAQFLGTARGLSGLLLKA
jgi:hypothetical protein